MSEIPFIKARMSDAEALMLEFFQKLFFLIYTIFNFIWTISNLKNFTGVVKCSVVFLNSPILLEKYYILDDKDVK